MSSKLSHLDEHGAARMVDVGSKPVTERVCVARARVHMQAGTLEAIAQGRVPKGDVFSTARIAGIQAAKRTSEWIPLAHPLPIESIQLDFRPDPAGPCVQVEAAVRTHARTGVEMEALVAVSAAALTLYDMCKAIDRAMSVSELHLVSKSGGKSGS